MIPGLATPDGTARFAQKSGADGANYNEFAGLALSNVGVGTYLGDADGATDSAVAAAVTASVRAGINVIDTAINYRSQKAERSVGRALRAMSEDGTASRDGLFVSTKGGYVTNDADVPLGFWEYVKKEYTDAGIIRQGDITPSYHCMTPRFLSAQLDRSLANLGLESVDLLYLHNAVEGQVKHTARPKFLEALGQAFGMYEDARRDGRLGFYGMATWECFRVPQDSPLHLPLEEVVDIAKAAGGPGHGFRFVQLPFNMYYDQALMAKTQQVGGRAVTPLEAAGLLGIGVFTSVPLMQGRLLAPGTMPDFGDLPPALRALQFVRSCPGVLAPLVGHKDPAHVAENLKMMGIPPIPADEFAPLLKSLTSRAPGGGT